MSIFKSLKQALGKVVDTVGYASGSTAAAKLIKDETGISAGDQATIGASAGFLNMLGGSLSGSDGNTSLLSSVFGSGDNSLSSILGSVVKGAVGIGTSYFENQQYLKDQKALNAQKFGYDRQLADEAYQRDVAMWNMQNAYNTPKKQMARLESAGLNPNLVYGSGNVTGNTAGSPPSYPQVQYPSSSAQKLDLMRNVLGIFNEYQSIKNQALENQRQNARLELQREALALQGQRSDRQFDLALASLDLRRQQFDYLKDNPKSWIGRNWSDIKGIGKELYDRGREIVSSNKTSNRGSGNWVSRIGSARYSR